MTRLRYGMRSVCHAYICIYELITIDYYINLTKCSISL